MAMLPINLPGNIHQLTRYHMRLANQASSVPTLAAVALTRANDEEVNRIQF